jgi:hypothetical protein
MSGMRSGGSGNELRCVAPRALEGRLEIDRPAGSFGARGSPVGPCDHCGAKPLRGEMRRLSTPPLTLPPRRTSPVARSSFLPPDGRIRASEDSVR